MAPGPSSDYKPETWVYLGVRHDGMGEALYHWRKPNGDTPGYKKAPKGSPIVGCKYEVMVSGSSMQMRVRFLGQWDDDQERKELQAESRAHATALAAYRMAKKKELAELDDMTLYAARVKLAGMPRPLRQALLAVILGRLGV